MTLDISTVDGDGTPERWVSLPYDEHYDLLAHAKKLNLPVIQKLAEYFADARIGVAELPAFTSEVQAILPLVRDTALAQVLEELLPLIEYARERHVDLEAIAD